MDVVERAKYLKDRLGPLSFNKSAAEIPKGILFPKLEGPAKPPKLTPPKLPDIKIENSGEIPSLPKMNVEGYRPKYKSPLKKSNPYRPY